MIVTSIILFVGAVIAFWISAICGGGASLILIPVLNLMLPVPVVPFSLTIGTFASSISRIFVFRKHIYWPVFFWFVPFSLPAVWLGASLLRYVNPVYIQLFIAIFLLINVVELFKRKRASLLSNARSGLRYGIIGFLAGLVSGLTGAVGLLFNRFYLKIGLSKEQIIATRAANEVCLHFIKLVLYIALGIWSGKAFLLGIAIALASIVSATTIKYILPLLSERLFSKIAYTSMALSGAFLLFSTTSDIMNSNNFSLTSHSYEDGYDAVLAWNDGHFSLEYSDGEFPEIERAVTYNELPHHLKSKYDNLALVYHNIELEQVYNIKDNCEYEVYGYKNNRRYKLKL